AMIPMPLCGILPAMFPHAAMRHPTGNVSLCHYAAYRQYFLVPNAMTADTARKRVALYGM
ncbi:MAG: hypothetical protein K2K77_02990, partial [Duncaniella sp.]|nr:hypothetical protein [Duncaniella sp.]